MKKMGQTVIEFSVILAIMCAVCLLMQNYVRRSVFGRFKLMEERINAEKQVYSTIDILGPFLEKSQPKWDNPPPNLDNVLIQQ